MKNLITSELVEFGPFNDITVGTDRYVCDGTDYPFTVVGNDCTIVDAVIVPPVIVVPVPQEVTMRQARLALLGANLLSQVEPIIAALDEPARSQAMIEWEYSSSVQRHNGFVSTIAPLLGLSETQLDDLFRAAINL